MAVLNPQHEIALQPFGTNAKSMVISTQSIVSKLRDGFRRMKGRADTCIRLQITEQIICRIV